MLTFPITYSDQVAWKRWLEKDCIANAERCKELDRSYLVFQCKTSILVFRDAFSSSLGLKSDGNWVTGVQILHTKQGLEWAGWGDEFFHESMSTPPPPPHVQGAMNRKKQLLFTYLFVPKNLPLPMCTSQRWLDKFFHFVWCSQLYCLKWHGLGFWLWSQSLEVWFPPGLDDP